MPPKSVILVTSAAGKTGLPTSLKLLELGFPVRAFVRRRDARAEGLEQAGAALFVGDQYALSDMRRGMIGVHRAYQCAPTAPNGLHFNAVFTVAAQEAGIEHVVTLGQWLAAAEHPREPGHVRLKAPRFCQDSREWLETHGVGAKTEPTEKAA